MRMREWIVCKERVLAAWVEPTAVESEACEGHAAAAFINLIQHSRRMLQFKLNAPVPAIRALIPSNRLLRVFYTPCIMPLDAGRNPRLGLTNVETGFPERAMAARESSLGVWSVTARPLHHAEVSRDRSPCSCGATSPGFAGTMPPRVLRRFRQLSISLPRLHACTRPPRLRW